MTVYVCHDTRDFVKKETSCLYKRCLNHAKQFEQTNKNSGKD